jgi:putative tryptophan/tyrosine transport system substrate-binding protein
MRRRDFIKIIAGSTVALPFAARAQQPMPLIGALHMQTPDTEAPRLVAIRLGLKETGFIEGQNVAFEHRFAEGRNDRLPSLAADLVHRQVKVIVANTTPPALAAKAATLTIPIVFAFGADPVELGIVASFNRPGANITGVAFLVNKLVGKRLELLGEVLPRTVAIGMLSDPNNPNSATDVKETQAAAIALGRTLIVATAATQNELDSAYAALAQQRVGALFVAPHANFRIWQQSIVALSARYRLPSSYSTTDWAKAGGLMSYGTDLSDAYRQVGIYVGRILKGEKPAGMPVVQPTKFEFVINLKTAKALGLTIPPTLLTSATEVIE